VPQRPANALALNRSAHHLDESSRSSTTAESGTPTSSNAPSARPAWRVKVIGRLPGEASCVNLVWAVLDRASRGWRGMTMAPTGTRPLNDIRHQLLDPSTPLRPTDTTKITGAAKLSEPSPNMTTEEPSRSSFTPPV
jgi:hypothetical protein